MCFIFCARTLKVDDGRNLDISSTQTKVLEDMLRFEKQRGEAEESAFKAQKKLLVTEVKKLRTTNLGLKAECDDLRQQLKDLRKSVSQLGR